MENLSAADVAAVTRNNYGYPMMGCGGWGGFGGDWLGLIVLAALFGGFGGGFGGFGGGGGWQQGFNTQNILSKLDGITNGISDATYALNNSINGINMNLSNALCSTTYELASKIDANRFAAQQCCCETNRNIDSVRYEAAKNTCDIVRAIEKDGDATRALINANVMQALRDKVAEKDQALQTANFHLSQQAQNAYLLNELRPVSKPAYITCSPYEASSYYRNSCCGF
jgi:hypothetical protein